MRLHAWQVHEREQELWWRGRTCGAARTRVLPRCVQAGIRYTAEPSVRGRLCVCECCDHRCGVRDAAGLHCTYAEHASAQMPLVSEVCALHQARPCARLLKGVGPAGSEHRVPMCPRKPWEGAGIQCTPRQQDTRWLGVALAECIVWPTRRGCCRARRPAVHRARARHIHAVCALQQCDCRRMALVPTRPDVMQRAQAQRRTAHTDPTSAPMRRDHGMVRRRITVCTR